MSESEQKRDPRLKRPFTARVRVMLGSSSKENSSAWDIVTLKDISGSGMLMNSTQKFEVGTQLEFNIALPAIPTPIHCVAEVCRVAENKTGSIPSKIQVYGIGVKFKDIDPSAVEAIRQICEGHS